MVLCHHCLSMAIPLTIRIRFRFCCRHRCWLLNFWSNSLLSYLLLFSVLHYVGCFCCRCHRSNKSSLVVVSVISAIVFLLLRAVEVVVVVTVVTVVVWFGGKSSQGMVSYQDIVSLSVLEFVTYRPKIMTFDCCLFQICCCLRLRSSSSLWPTSSDSVVYGCRMSMSSLVACPWL